MPNRDMTIPTPAPIVVPQVSAFAATGMPSAMSFGPAAMFAGIVPASGAATIFGASTQPSAFIASGDRFQLYMAPIQSPHVNRGIQNWLNAGLIRFSIAASHGNADRAAAISGDEVRNAVSELAVERRGIETDFAVPPESADEGQGAEGGKPEAKRPRHHRGHGMRAHSRTTRHPINPSEGGHTATDRTSAEDGNISGQTNRIPAGNEVRQRTSDADEKSQRKAASPSHHVLDDSLTENAVTGNGKSRSRPADIGILPRSLFASKTQPADGEGDIYNDTEGRPWPSAVDSSENDGRGAVVYVLPASAVFANGGRQAWDARRGTLDVEVRKRAGMGIFLSPGATGIRSPRENGPASNEDRISRPASAGTDGRRETPGKSHVVMNATVGDIPVRRHYVEHDGRHVFAGWEGAATPLPVAQTQVAPHEHWTHIWMAKEGARVLGLGMPGGETAFRPTPGELQGRELEARFVSLIISQLGMGPESLTDPSILDSFNKYLAKEKGIGDPLSEKEWGAYLSDALRFAVRYTPIFGESGIRAITEVKDDAARVLRVERERFYEWEDHFGMEMISEHLFEGESSEFLALPDSNVRRRLYLALSDGLAMRAGITLDMPTEAGVSHADETKMQWEVAIASMIEDPAVKARVIKERIAFLMNDGKTELAGRMLALIVGHSEVGENGTHPGMDAEEHAG